VPGDGPVRWLPPRRVGCAATKRSTVCGGPVRRGGPRLRLRAAGRESSATGRSLMRQVCPRTEHTRLVDRLVGQNEAPAGPGNHRGRKPLRLRGDQARRSFPAPAPDSQDGSHPFPRSPPKAVRRLGPFCARSDRLPPTGRAAEPAPRQDHRSGFLNGCRAALLPTQLPEHRLTTRPQKPATLRNSPPRPPVDLQHLTVPNVKQHPALAPDLQIQCTRTLHEP